MYYVLSCPIIVTEEERLLLSEIQTDEEVGDIWSWDSGEKFEPDEESSIPSPIEMEVKFFRGYKGPPEEMNDLDVCVMSKRLSHALTGAGVDNIDYYPVVLRHKKSGQSYDYAASTSSER